MARTQYAEIACKSALNRVEGMPFRWSLNPYRGCVHACHYCYARATHAYFGLNAGDDFSSRILVKTNLAEVLRRELTRPSWAGESVSVGTATDPYQPCEGRYRLTRAALAALAERANPVSVVTKSTLVLRDLDLLVESARQTEVTVFFTITTLDPDTWRTFEPGTPPPAKRLLAMSRLAAAGVPCGVFLAPILPGITDSSEEIEAVAAAAREHGAVSFGASVLRLAPLVKEHYLETIAAIHPRLLDRYARAYPGANAPSGYRAAIEQRVALARARHGFAADAMRRAPGNAASRTGETPPARRPWQLPLLI